MNATLRIAAVVVAAATSGCAWPYSTTSHVDPADAAWVVVVSPASRGCPVQYRLDEHPPELVAADLVERVDSGPLRFGEQWIVSPDGRRVAYVEHVLKEPRFTERTRVATDGRPWRFEDVPDVGEPLAWSPDARLLLCRNSEKTGEGAWRYGFALVDVESGAKREFWDVGVYASAGPWNVAFSPDGARLAFETNDFRVAVLDLATGAVADPGLPEAGGSAGVLGWLADGRIAYRVDGRVLLARPGDASATEFPTDVEEEWPISTRPDGGAVLCTVERTPMFSMYKRLGYLVRHADGGREDLDLVEGRGWAGGEDSVVWFRAPGLPATPAR